MMETMGNLRSYSQYLMVASVSITLHVAFLFSTSRVADRYADPDLTQYLPMHLSREEPTPEAPPKVEEKPAPKKIELPKKQKAVRKVLSAAETKTLAKSVPPVQGLPPAELSKNANGMAVPLGNTTMMKDDGRRHTDVKGLPRADDLSTQPQLIRSSVEIPEYTSDALDNDIEGTFDVAVFVDENGEVIKAELKRKIGYGMDDRVVAAAKKVHFLPGKDRYGKEIGEWTEIKFRLQIP